MLNKKFGRGKGLYTNKNPNDDIMTPLEIAKDIITMFDIKGKILDPFKGDGSFYNQFPDDLIKDWCEIKENKDFFDYYNHVDWIISNPPYSILDEVLEHSFKIADNIVYLLPLSKIVSSMGRIRKISNYGGVPYIYILSASKCRFPFGFPACAIYMKKNYKGNIQVLIDK